MSGRGKQARALAKKRLILDAAAELIREDGLRCVTHRQVAARAGVPVGSIGYYYNTREELLATALAQLDARRHARAVQLLQQAPASPTLAQTAELLLGIIFEGDVSERGLRGWLTTGVDCIRESAELNDALRVPRDQLTADLAEALAAAGYPGLSADAVIVAVAGAVVMGLVRDVDDCPGTVRDNLIGLLERHAG